MTVSTPSNPLGQILFVTHKEKHCGVHEYGISVAEALKKSTKYLFTYAECSNANELSAAVKDLTPKAIIYNYYPSTLPWLKKELMRKFEIPSLGIMHEVTQRAADSADTSLFDYHIAPDPTLVLNNPIVFKTGRLIPQYSHEFSLPKITTIGSFGFASAGKGFERLIIAVQEEFDEAIIRLHVPSGDFMDSNVKDVVKRCKDLIIKPGIKLVATHEFLKRPQLLDFLAQNTLNAFFYDKLEGRGISSTIEIALAARRPIAVTRSTMFRHILSNNSLPTDPPICIERTGKPGMSLMEGIDLRLRRRAYLRHTKNKFPAEWLLKPTVSLKQIIDNGIAPLERFHQQWNERNFILDYDRILDRVFVNRNHDLQIPHQQPSALRLSSH
ncbi:MAG: hypothetical protein H7Z16_19710 [Pyrinomonadaceae bacterium]|nr:hypothetical protein [Pyrinomonadaceae bacterium]